MMSSSQTETVTRTTTAESGLRISSSGADGSGSGSDTSYRYGYNYAQQHPGSSLVSGVSFGLGTSANSLQGGPRFGRDTFIVNATAFPSFNASGTASGTTLRSGSDSALASSPRDVEPRSHLHRNQESLSHARSQYSQLTPAQLPLQTTSHTQTQTRTLTRIDCPDEESLSHSQYLQTARPARSHQWIADIPIVQRAEVDALRSPQSTFGSATLSTPANFPPSSAGYQSNQDASHVPYYSEPYGLGAPSGTRTGADQFADHSDPDAEAEPFRPPSLAAYTLTTQADSWRDNAYVPPPSLRNSRTAAAWTAPQYSASSAYRDFDSGLRHEWSSPPSSRDGAPSRALTTIDASPMHSGSPESTTSSSATMTITSTAASSLWASIPPATDPPRTSTSADSDDTRSARTVTYANKLKVLSAKNTTSATTTPTTSAAPPGLTRSALAGSSFSSGAQASSLLEQNQNQNQMPIRIPPSLAYFSTSPTASASGTSITPTSPPTSARARTSTNAVGAGLVGRAADAAAAAAAAPAGVVAAAVNVSPPRAPGSATPFGVLPVSPSSASAPGEGPNYSNFVAARPQDHTQRQRRRTALDGGRTPTPPSGMGRTYLSSPHPRQARSPIYTRLAHIGSSSELEVAPSQQHQQQHGRQRQQQHQHRHETDAAFQVPPRQSVPIGQTSPGDARTGYSSGSSPGSSGAMASGLPPPGPDADADAGVGEGTANHLFVDNFTNTGSYRAPAPPAPPASAARVSSGVSAGPGLVSPSSSSPSSSSPLTTRGVSIPFANTVPVTIAAAKGYKYSYYTSPPGLLGAESVPDPGPAPPAPALATTPTTITTGSGTTITATPGSSTSGSIQSTRKRNHACWMCHKSFDRPSTLRKHLLVHTGEKAFVCNICGRRFGVASNLNRHTRRCITKPVNSSTFHSQSNSNNPTAGPSSASSLSIVPTATANRDESAMAREQTNPDVRRIERERDGRELRDGDPFPLASAPDASESSGANPSASVVVRPPRGRRRGRSITEAPLGDQNYDTSISPEDSPSFQRGSSDHLRPAFGDTIQSGSGSSQVGVATASSSTSTDANAERRPKRRRRAPSPSRWVPASLRTFSLSPVRQRTTTPLPAVSPGYDAATGAYEERDSYAGVPDENVDPSAGTDDTNTSARGRTLTREERIRNFEFAPYHPCGWTGRLPGPAVVGADLTNYTKQPGGSGSGKHYHGGPGGSGSAGGGMSFMFEFSLAAAG